MTMSWTQQANEAIARKSKNRGSIVGTSRLGSLFCRAGSHYRIFETSLHLRATNISHLPQYTIY